MICTKCNNPGVENQALGKVFYYCRTCKDEVRLEEPKGITKASASGGFMEVQMITLDQAMQMFPPQKQHCPPSDPGYSNEQRYHDGVWWYFRSSADSWERI